MGYCPYMCIVCGTVEDNGWNNRSICKAMIENKECVITDLSKRQYDDDDIITYDVCDDCLKTSLEPPKEKHVCIVCADVSSEDDGRNVFSDNEMNDLILKFGKKCWINKIPETTVGIKFDICDDCLE